MKIAAGDRAWTRDREAAPIVRNTMDRARVVKNEKTRKIKNAAGSRRKLVMKYNTRLNEMLLQILYGMSHNADEMASVKGWYRAYLACFSTIGLWA